MQHLINTGQGEGKFITRDSILRHNMTFAIYRTGAQLKLATGNIISRQNSTLATDWTGAQVKLPPEMLKVQLTPEIFFAYINLFVSLITAAKKLSL